VSNHALLQFVYSEHLRPITVCPTRIEGIPLLVQPTYGVRPPLDLQSVFIRSLGWLIVPLGVANSTIGIPGLLPLLVWKCDGI
jgi:hypothetical protein